MGAKIFVKALASCSLDLQYRSFNDDSDSKVSQMLAMLTLCTLLQCRKRAEYLFWIIFMTASLSCSSIAGCAAQRGIPEFPGCVVFLHTKPLRRRSLPPLVSILPRCFAFCSVRKLEKRFTGLDSKHYAAGGFC